MISLKDAIVKMDCIPGVVSAKGKKIANTNYGGEKRRAPMIEIIVVSIARK